MRFTDTVFINIIKDDIASGVRKFKTKETFVLRTLCLLFALTFIFTGSAYTSSAFQQSEVYTCPMHPEVQSSTPGNCPKCEMKLVTESELKKEKAAQAGSTSSDQTTAGSEQTGDYTCPMHPNVRSNVPGKCPKCEMALISVIPSVPEDFRLVVEATPKMPKPGEKLHLQFDIQNPRTGERVKDFHMIHEKYFHLFIISQDMKQFQHIHPRQDANGTFVIDTTLPNSGSYKVYSDFHPAEGVPQVLQTSIQTAGYSTDLFAGVAHISPDQSFVKVVEGDRVTKENAANIGVDFGSVKKKDLNPLKVELKIEPEEIIAGKPVTLTYKLSDSKTGEPIHDLSPYLGAMGHTLILSEDQTDYVHTHPEQEPFDPDDPASLFGGPQVRFEALFPRPGRYRIWTQFLRGDMLNTVIFNVKVSRLQ